MIALRVKDRDRERPFRMWGGVWLPCVTALIFLAMGIGVFAQPGIEAWGAGLLLVLLGLAWWLYIHFVAQPRLTTLRAQAAARPSRRPPKNNP